MIHWLERFHILIFLGASATLTPSRGSGQLPYQVLGEGEPTVVVLHGGPGVTHDYLRPEWDRLAEVARVVYYDQRGCGSGSGELGPVTWQRHVDDLRVLIGEVSPEGVVLAGSSWGSSLALLFSIEHPDLVQALVLSGLPTWPTVVRGDSSVPPRLETRLDSLERSLPVDPWPQPDTLGSGGEVSAIAADERVSSRVVACPGLLSRVFGRYRMLRRWLRYPPLPSSFRGSKEEGATSGEGSYPDTC